ncbi:FAD-dependent oxidoreductase [Thalassobius vesicularis]|uniref:FAD-dependent oxidoreductase n=1 Tax=Thalassobius vesicularis TaxID=1294297 RepID=A0A4V3UYM4_9RHOB|nr:FAD-dependent oxidoreductase [Thalassobius vesicularis]THD71564.1 FAD-dependent oxidoreductase [Thalassobius vesicularis]
MSFDLPHSNGQRIAIIGGGISGLAAAWLLQGRHHVTLYESEPRLGGHARTVLAGRNGDQPVDTGFIVFNYVNYPHLTRMFADLDVPVHRSDMSFGATIDGGRVEYGLRDLSALIGQKRNLLRPGFARMVRDILHFNAQAEAAATSDDLTIGDLIEQLNLGRWFRDYYLLPVCGAIWSTPASGIRDFPARALVQFFRNHALLSATGQHQWWTVSGGSIEYVRRLEANLRARGVQIRTKAPVRAVTRLPGQATVHLHDAPAETYDQVILACHSDTALKLLAHPTTEERRALSDIRYQDNQMVLHRDITQMPRRRSCWSSWVYQAQTGEQRSQIGVTYWMNRLQGIPETDPLFVTLNPAHPVQEAAIYDAHTFRHPVFDRAALAAQTRIAAMQGANNTWFAGAWLRHGFHEDGFASAVRVAEAIGQQTPARLAAE